MGKRILRHLCTLVAVAALGAAAYLGSELVKKELEYKKGQDQLQDIYAVMEYVEERVEAERPEGTEQQPEVNRLIQYQVLREQNDDMVGWIQIEGTQVAYPVMYTPDDPEFYMNHGFDKKYSSYGMIFIDANCAPDSGCTNTLIYGHHMRNGDMFASIENYDDPAYFKAHPYIEYDTLEELGVYQVIAAFKRPAASLDQNFMEMILARTEEDYQNLMSSIRQWRFYDTGVESEWGDTLITLATCEYTQGDGRFFVVAKKVSE
ncbi:MAG: class B sortase [Enterocloster sp.]